jgi:G2/mitotic-specific cyclin-B, other
MNHIDAYKENRSSSYKKSIEAARKALSSLSINKMPSRQSPQLIEKSLKHANEYSSEIIINLKQEECLYEQPKDFIKNQHEVNSNSRGILISWLVSIHRYLKLLQETFYISVSIVDRYLSKKSITKYQLQLLGVTSLFLAAKYEEIYPPEFSKFLKVTENCYSKAQIVLMEKEILKALDFKLTVPTPWVFYQKFCESGGLTRTENFMGQYILELSQLEIHIQKYKPSIKAASAIFIAQKYIRKENSWRMQNITGYGEQDFKECFQDMNALIQIARFNPLKSIREKYSSQEFDAVAMN